MSLLLGRLVAARRSDRTAARAVPLGYLGRLLRALEHEATAAAGRRVGIPGLVEALGERELEVLFDKLGRGQPDRGDRSRPRAWTAG